MGYVTGEEIMGLARQIKELAIRRRAEEELQWAAKDSIPDSRFQDPDFNHNIVRGGTTADYQQLNEGYAWIVEAFQNAIGPEPSGLDGAIQGMDAVRRKLRGNARPIVYGTVARADGNVSLIENDDSRDSQPLQMGGRIDNRLKGWQGPAASNFVQNFAIPLPDVFENQTLMVSALRSALSTNRTVYARARDDLKALAQATIDALNFKTGSGGPSFTMTLSVVTGVLSVAAACVAAPGAIIFFTAASSAAGIAKDAMESPQGDDPKPQGKEYQVGGHTVDTILSTTYDLIQETQRSVAISEDTIIRGLRDNYELLTSWKTRASFVSPRPTVADTRTELANVRDHCDFFPN